MIKFWYIGDHADFHTSRSGRIGASDVPAIFQNPENPTESLAGYGRTALTVYQEKRGEIEREPAGLAAEMGHFLENKALELFIRRFSGPIEASTFFHEKVMYEGIINGLKNVAYARDYQSTPYKHNAQYYTEGMIAHPDCVYIGNSELLGNPQRFKTVEGVRVDLSKPFIIEAKSARKFAAKRPEGSLVKGYDLDLSTWQGIPLKHYFQIQFQLALFQIDVAYLALIHDTSDFHVWRIDRDKKTQNIIIDRVGRMVKHIKDGTMPRELAMNANDVITMIPEIKKDFIMPSGEKLESVLAACREANKAKNQKEIWDAKEKDAKNALAVYLDEYEEIRNGADVLAKWANGSTGEKLSCSIKDLKKNHPSRYRSMVKAGLIKPARNYRYVSVKWNGDEE